MTPGQRRPLLLRQAHSACRLRGHIMRPFQRLGPGRGVWESICGLCGKAAWVTPHPLPNETEIAGQAVALGCSWGNP